jgi:hypothetical protein
MPRFIVKATVRLSVIADNVDAAEERAWSILQALERKDHGLDVSVIASLKDETRLAEGGA